MSLILAAMKKCPQCQTLLPLEARFCFQCGTLQLPVLTTSTREGFDWHADWVAQAYKRFLQRLEERVQAEQEGAKLPGYQERIRTTDYRETVMRRLQQWTDAHDTRTAPEQPLAVLHELKILLDDLLDFFFIMHAADLNVVVLPESILRYQHVRTPQIDLAELAFHYLAFEQEEERIYTDFITMPVNKIRNAGKYFLFPDRQEKIWFICDQSLLGNAKEGFAMTEKALYWKSGLQGAQRVFYHKLVSLQKEKEWLLINDLFFNATPSLNTKLIWLLRKLARLFQAEL